MPLKRGRGPLQKFHAAIGPANSPLDSGGSRPALTRASSRDYFNAQAARHNIPTINFQAIVDELARRGIPGLNNGLTREENRRLFTTPSLFEQVSLVLRGLRNARACKHHV